MFSDGCFWRIKLATSLLQLLYCHDPHRTVGILLCVFALAMSVNFLMLSTQPDFLRHGLAFPSPPRKTASSSLPDGQLVLPLLELLTFGGSIHGSCYLIQPEALYATPTTRMILFVLCLFIMSCQYIVAINITIAQWLLLLQVMKERWIDSDHARITQNKRLGLHWGFPYLNIDYWSLTTL